MQQLVLILRRSKIRPPYETRFERSWVPWLLVTVALWEDTSSLHLFQDSNGRPLPEPRRPPEELKPLPA